MLETSALMAAALVAIVWAVWVTVRIFELQGDLDHLEGELEALHARVDALERREQWRRRDAR